MALVGGARRGSSWARVDEEGEEWQAWTALHTEATREGQARSRSEAGK